MIKFQATALVHIISPVIQVTERFQKRELILDDSWDKDGNHYSNFVLVEFTGDKMAQLDNFFPGQRVTVEGVINGREYNNRIYNTVKGQTITLYQQQSQYAAAPAPAPMPGSYSQQPQYATAPIPAPAPMASPHQQQVLGQHTSPGVADLPFPH